MVSSFRAISTICLAGSAVLVLLYDMEVLDITGYINYSGIAYTTFGVMLMAQSDNVVEEKTKDCELVDIKVDK